MKAFSEVCSNPAAMDKYKNNPKVMKVIEKMKNRFGGGGGGAMPGKSTIPTDLDLNNVYKLIYTLKCTFFSMYQLTDL